MDKVSAIRAFNRFYTRHIGVLSAGLLDTPYSLTEARILFEIGARETCETGELRRMLGLDAGYLSRILSRFETDGLITRERSAADARRQVIRLTETGRKARAMLDERSAEQIRGVLAPLSEEDQRRLVSAMGVIQEILGGARPAQPYVIRPPRPGELGWVVHRHGVLYHDEYGWDETFEQLVLDIVAEYVAGQGDKGVAAWIAELDGEDKALFLEELGIKESGLDRLIKAAYKLLGLQTYFTAGEQEVRAWTIRKGTKAPQAAGVIHSDFERGFIRAEVVSYEDFVAAGSMNAVRERGQLRLEGKDYVVQDGDIMHFRFNV